MNIATGRVRILILFIVLLVISNLILAFLLFNKNDRDPRKDRDNAMVNFLQKDVGFDAVQLKTYDSLKTAHRAKMKANGEKMRDLKKENLNTAFSSGFADTVVTAIALRSGEQQRLMETEMMNYFKTLRSICTPEQQKKFDTGFTDVLFKRKN